MRVFPDGEMREQPELTAHRRKSVEGGQGNEHLVAHALDLDRDLGGVGLDQFSLQKGDHVALAD